MKKVFLGGTCNGSLWREGFMDQLKIGYFNPVGSTWTDQMKNEELVQRMACDFCLYVITPKSEGCYAVAELIEDSIKRPGRTIFCYIDKDDGKYFSDVQIRSLEEVAKMVQRNGAYFFKTLGEVTTFLNTQ